MNLKIGDRVLVKSTITERFHNAIVEEIDSDTEFWVSKPGNTEQNQVSINDIEPIVSRNGILVKI